MNGPTNVTVDDHGPTPASTGWMVLEPGGGERLRFLGASTMLIKLDGATNPGLAFYEYVSEPGVTGPPQHVHHAHDETFFVVDGEYEFTIGRERLPMPTGSFLYVPRGTPHTFRNAGADLGRIVGTFNPPRFADYFHDLSAIISATGGPPDHEEWADLYRRYETTFFDAGPTPVPGTELVAEQPIRRPEPTRTGRQPVTPPPVARRRGGRPGRPSSRTARPR